MEIVRSLNKNDIYDRILGENLSASNFAQILPRHTRAKVLDISGENRYVSPRLTNEADQIYEIRVGNSPIKAQERPLSDPSRRRTEHTLPEMTVLNSSEMANIWGKLDDSYSGHEDTRG